MSIGTVTGGVEFPGHLPVPCVLLFWGTGTTNPRPSKTPTQARLSAVSQARCEATLAQGLDAR